MSKSTLDHIHEYVKFGVKFGELHYKCNHPDCFHTAPVSLIEGKRTMCAICHQKDFILTREDLRRAKPRCPDCSETREAVERRKLQAVLGEVLGEGEGGPLG